ncbi:MAG: cytochrome c oxidase subunit II [Luteitalea sp.]|nr:cytochrome c oxidase subunit II [Luteitalea sp.]
MTFPFMPEQGSTMAARVDNLFFFFLAVSAFFAVLIAVLVVVFAVKYRRRDETSVGAPIHGGLALELTWTLIPFAIAMVMFVWGASVYFDLARPPQNAVEIYVTGKRWMWKVQHLTGQKEINALHVPVGQPVKLIIQSEDVIHSFFIPAFRTKMDAVPGRITTLWFEATKPGRYHLFCAEYCGTNHSGMTGYIEAMEPNAFQTWLGGSPEQEGSLADAGEQLFNQLGCVTCHSGDSQARGPDLRGQFGTTVTLADGQQVLFDEEYARESILNPQAKMVEGYLPLMPTFQGLVNEDGLAQLIEYVKSLSQGGETPTPAAAPGGTPKPKTTPGAAER